MVMRNRLAQRGQTSGEVVELAVMVRQASDDAVELAVLRIEPAVEGVEPAIVPGNPAGHFGQQLIDGGDIGAVAAAHAIPRTMLARPPLYTHFSPRQRKRLSLSRRAANGNIVPSEREKLRCFQA